MALCSNRNSTFDFLLLRIKLKYFKIILNFYCVFCFGFSIFFGWWWVGCCRRRFCWRVTALYAINGIFHITLYVFFWFHVYISSVLLNRWNTLHYFFFFLNCYFCHFQNDSSRLFVNNMFFLRSTFFSSIINCKRKTLCTTVFSKQKKYRTGKIVEAMSSTK